MVLRLRCPPWAGAISAALLCVKSSTAVSCIPRKIDRCVFRASRPCHSKSVCHAWGPHPAIDMIMNISDSPESKCTTMHPFGALMAVPGGALSSVWSIAVQTRATRAYTVHLIVRVLHFII